MTKIELIARVLDEINQTNHLYAQIQKTGTKVFPIPYFGNLGQATVVTVGINPSATEFRSPRWENGISSATELDAIITSYFACGAHPWFAAWEDSLNLLGHSYRKDAAHLDLSPRATQAMGSADKRIFLEMIQNDIKWFFEVLEFCPKLELILAAGCVTNKYYMDEFLKRNLPKGYRLELKETFEKRSRGSSALYMLTGPKKNLPLFFCSSSPSSRDKGVRLKSEIARNAPSIPVVIDTQESLSFR